jgi:hypothetical protein
MRTTICSGLISCVALFGAMAAIVGVIAQEGERVRPDLSGRWQLNRERSENAQQKLDRMQSPRGHGPARHGFGGLFGRLFGRGDLEEARRMVLNAPPSFSITHDGDRIVLTASDGKVRTLTANGRKERVNGRDVLTRWDGQKLVSEASIGDANVTDTYERSASPPQLIVTTNMDMRGHSVSVRRVYDVEGLK